MVAPTDVANSQKEQLVEQIHKFKGFKSETLEERKQAVAKAEAAAKRIAQQYAESTYLYSAVDVSVVVCLTITCCHITGGGGGGRGGRSGCSVCSDTGE